MSEKVKSASKISEVKDKNSPFQTRRTAISQSLSSPIDQILFLQRTIGNQAVEELFKSGAIQAKLKISQPNDKYEQEADRVADRVMKMSNPFVRGKEGLTCNDIDEEERIQAKPLFKRIIPLIQRQAEPEENTETVDSAIAALDLAANAKKAAYELKKKHPEIVMTSGRRSVSEQAKVMANNIIKSNDRKWIEKTYSDTSSMRKLQKWVDDHSEATTAYAIAKGLEEVFNTLTDRQKGYISKHLTGEAFDVQPVTENAEEIKSNIRMLPGIKKFLEREGDLIIWHAQYKKISNVSNNNDKRELETDKITRWDVHYQDQTSNKAKLKFIRGFGQADIKPSAVKKLSLTSNARPLDDSLRAFFEPRFAYNFRDVRVHTDAHAAETTRALNARAFTMGCDIVFGARQYAPKTKEGKRLLTHELTHVVQQQGGVSISNKTVKTVEKVMPKEKLAPIPKAVKPSDETQPAAPEPEKTEAQTEHEATTSKEPPTFKYPNIRKKYKTWQEYENARKKVVKYGESEPEAYIEEAAKQWLNAFKDDKEGKDFFKEGFDGKAECSYLNLKRLYKAKHIDNPAQWVKTDIKWFSFFNIWTQGTDMLKGALENVEKNWPEGEKKPEFTQGETWAFNARIKRGGSIHDLSTHAPGKAIDIEPQENPMLGSNDRKVVALVTGVDLGKEQEFDTMKQASESFKEKYENWVEEQKKELELLKPKKTRVDEIEKEITSYGKEWTRAHKKKAKELTKKEYEEWNTGLKQKIELLKKEKVKIEEDIKGVDIDKLGKLIGKTERSKEYWEELKSNKKQKASKEELLEQKREERDEIEKEIKSYGKEWTRVHKKKAKELTKKEYEEWNMVLKQKIELLKKEKDEIKKEIGDIISAVKGIIKEITEIEKKHRWVPKWAQWSEQGFLNLKKTLVKAMIDVDFTWLGERKAGRDFMHFEL